MDNGNFKNSASARRPTSDRLQRIPGSIPCQSRRLLEKLFEARSLIGELLDIPDDYHILILNTENEKDFSIASLLNDHRVNRAAYLDSGQRSSAAIRSARAHLEVEIAGSSRESAYSYIPGMDWIPQNVSFLHVTSTNEQQGNTIPRYPRIGIPLICDMSSDLFFSGTDIKSFDLVYAHGSNPFVPDQLCLIIVKNNFLNGRASKMLQSSLLIDEHTNLTTRCLKSMLFAFNALRSVEKKGGIAVNKLHLEKSAKALYREIERNLKLYAPVMPAYRSKLTVRFCLFEPKEKLLFASLLDAGNFSSVTWSCQNDFLVMICFTKEKELAVLIEVMREYESNFIDRG